MLYKEVNIIYTENRTKHVNTEWSGALRGSDIGGRGFVSPRMLIQTLNGDMWSASAALMPEDSSN